MKMFAEQMKMIEEELVPKVGTIMNIQDFFHLLSLRIFGQFSMGKDYSLPENQEIAKKINNGVKTGSNIIGSHIIMNIPMFSFLPSIKKVTSHSDYVNFVNFPNKQIGKFQSQFLLLGFPDADGAVVLIQPTLDTPLGGRLH